jgi:hypothetical protein
MRERRNGRKKIKGKRERKYEGVTERKGREKEREGRNICLSLTR